MPARDGTGPMEHSSKTGRDMGNCADVQRSYGQIPNAAPPLNQSINWGEWAWNSTFGRLFRRRAGSRVNC